MGLGDYTVQKVEAVDDPCPIVQNEEVAKKEELFEEGAAEPEAGNDNANTIGNNRKQKQQKKMRNLKANERTIYAPYCNLGFLNFEKSGGYISIPDDYVVFSKKDRPDVMMEDQESSRSSGEEREESEEESVEEGVQMVRDLQDLQKGIDQRMDEDEEDIDLLEGMVLDDKIHSKDQYTGE